jgi:hypothetical protein
MTTDNPKQTSNSTLENNEDLDLLKSIIEQNPVLREKVRAVMKKWLQKEEPKNQK